MIKRNTLLSLLALVLAALSIFFVQQQVLAQWTPPPSNPGGGSVSAPLTNPLNIDLNFQDIGGTRHSILNAQNGTFTGTVQGGTVRGTNLCIGADCKASWPAGEVKNPMDKELDAGGYHIFNIKSLDADKPGIYGGLEAVAGLNKIDADPTVSTVGVYAQTQSDSNLGYSYGVYGLSNNTGGFGIFGAATAGWAGAFVGPVSVNGELCLSGNCINDWSEVSGGASYWLANGSNIYYNAGNVGVNNNNPTGRLQVNAPAGTEALRLVSANNWSPLNIRNSADNADIFRVDQNGSLAVGTVPWARLGSYPSACPAGQYVTAVGGSLTCATPSGASLPAGATGQTLRHDGTNWVANSLLYNNGTNIGINQNSPDAPLTFAGAIGQKIHLYGGAGNNNAYVIGVQSGELRLATGLGATDFTSFYTGGYAGTERMRITPTGLGIGDNSPASLLSVGNGDLFQVNSSGDLIKVRNVTYSWPAAQGGNNTYLMNNGSGTLSWNTVSVSSLPWANLTSFPSACPAGQYVTAVGGSLTCATPSIAGLPAGISGQTMRYDGTNWVANSLLYNNGTNIGVGTTNPTTQLHLYNSVGGSNLSIQGNVADAEKWEIYQGTGTGAALTFKRNGQYPFYVYGTTGQVYDNRVVGQIFNATNYVVVAPPASGWLGQGGNVNNRLIVDGNIALASTGVSSRSVSSESSLYNIIDVGNNGGDAFSVFKVNTNTANKLLEIDEAGGYMIGFDGSSWAMQGVGANILLRRNLAIGPNLFSPSSALHLADGYYAQFQDNNAGAPPATDCDAAGELGRISIDTTNNRLYVCMGAARGWDYMALTN